MNLEQLISQYRLEAGDNAVPPFCLDDWLIIWFNEAQDEAAVRGRMLLEESNPAVCEIAIAPGTAGYALHPKLYEIAHLLFEPADGSRGCEVKLLSREKLDCIDPDWRTWPQEQPRFAIQTDTRLRLVPVPSAAGVLRLEGYRLPMKALASDNDKPEINEAHHLKLVDWVLYRAFGIPDADMHDPTRSGLAYTRFESYFGPRPDADLRRSTRHDEVQATEVQVF